MIRTIVIGFSGVLIFFQIKFGLMFISGLNPFLGNAYIILSILIYVLALVLLITEKNRRRKIVQLSIIVSSLVLSMIIPNEPINEFGARRYYYDSYFEEDWKNFNNENVLC